jgi:bifunctional non-homologous end joining protein LigD
MVSNRIEATRTYHPSVRYPSKAEASKVGRREIEIPSNTNFADIAIGNRTVKLTNLQKVFWPGLGITKGDLLRYYLSVSHVLLPHLIDRAMVMKRYPNGIDGEFFFMKRAPSPRPDWIELCSIHHSSGNIIGFPIVRDLASLLWVINLGCIDLNQWYARCDDVDRPDYLHFDLDPVGKVDFQRVIDAALFVREALQHLDMPAYAKTTGSRGIHIYVPIVRGPLQKQVWAFAKEFSHAIASQRPQLLTAIYEKKRRPPKHVLVDYNQNAWGRTLASVYSVRPTPAASVSTPVTWAELERGVRIEDFRIDNVPKRLAKLGDLWKPLLQTRGRLHLERYL